MLFDQGEGEWCPIYHAGLRHTLLVYCMVHLT